MNTIFKILDRKKINNLNNLLPKTKQEEIKISSNNDKELKNKDSKFEDISINNKNNNNDNNNIDIDIIENSNKYDKVNLLNNEKANISYNIIQNEKSDLIKNLNSYKNSLINKVLSVNCLVLSNGYNFIEEKYVYCHTCYPDNKEKICIECSINCHKHHVLSEEFNSIACCQCGLKNHKDNDFSKSKNSLKKLNNKLTCNFSEWSIYFNQNYYFYNETDCQVYCLFCSIMCNNYKKCILNKIDLNSENVNSKTNKIYTEKYLEENTYLHTYKTDYKPNSNINNNNNNNNNILNIENVDTSEYPRKCECMSSNHSDLTSILKIISLLDSCNYYQKEVFNNTHLINLLFRCKNSFKKIFKTFVKDINNLKLYISSVKKDNYNKTKDLTKFDITYNKDFINSVNVLHILSKKILEKSLKEYPFELIEEYILSKEFIFHLFTLFSYNNNNYEVLSTNVKLLSIFIEFILFPKINKLPRFTIEDFKNYTPIQRLIFASNVSNYNNIIQDIYGLSNFNIIDSFLNILESSLNIDFKPQDLCKLYTEVINVMNFYASFNLFNYQQFIKFTNLVNKFITHAYSTTKNISELSGYIDLISKHIYCINSILNCMLFITYYYNDQIIFNYISNNNNNNVNNIKLFHSNCQIGEILTKNAIGFLSYLRETNLKILPDNYLIKSIVEKTQIIFSLSLNNPDFYLNCLRRMFDKCHQYYLLMLKDEYILGNEDIYLNNIRQVEEKINLEYSNYLTLKDKDIPNFNKIESFIKYEIIDLLFNKFNSDVDFVNIEINEKYENEFNLNIDLEKSNNLITLNNNNNIYKCDNIKNNIFNILVDDNKNSNLIIDSIINNKFNNNDNKNNYNYLSKKKSCEFKTYKTEKTCQILLNKSFLFFTLLNSVKIYKSLFDDEKYYLHNIKLNNDFINTLSVFISFYIKDNLINSMMLLSNEFSEFLLNLNYEQLIDFIYLLYYALINIYISNITITESYTLFYSIEKLIRYTASIPEYDNLYIALLKVIKILGELKWEDKTEVDNIMINLLKEIFSVNKSNFKKLIIEIKNTEVFSNGNFLDIKYNNEHKNMLFDKNFLKSNTISNKSSSCDLNKDIVSLNNENENLLILNKADNIFVDKPKLIKKNYNNSSKKSDLLIINHNKFVNDMYNSNSINKKNNIINNLKKQVTKDKSINTNYINLEKTITKNNNLNNKLDIIDNNSINQKSNYTYKVSDYKPLDSTSNYNRKSLYKIFINFLSMVNIHFDGDATLNELTFLHQIFSTDEIIKLIRKKDIDLILRTEILKFFRVVYIDAIINLNQDAKYRSIIINKVKPNSYNDKFSDGLMFKFLEELLQVNKSLDNLIIESSIIKHELKFFIDIISKSSNSNPENVLEYFKNGILLPLYVFINKFVSIIYDKDGYENLKLYEIVIYFLRLKKYLIINKKLIHDKFDAEFQQIFSNFVLESNRKKLSILISKFNLEDAKEVQNDLDQMSEAHFEVLNYIIVYKYFDKHLKTFIEFPSKPSFQSIFKCSEYVYSDEDKKQKKKILYNNGLLHSNYEKKLFDLLIYYENLKNDIKKNGIINNISDQNLEFSKSNRYLILKGIFCFTTSNYISDKHILSSIWYILKLLQFETVECQEEIKKIYEDGSHNINFYFFGNILLVNTLSIILNSFNLDNIGFNRDYFIACNIIKIFKYLCEEHNQFFQKVFFNDLKFEYIFDLKDEDGYDVGAKTYISFFNFLLCIISKIILISGWDKEKLIRGEHYSTYYYDIFSFTIELCIEMIQGTTLENLNTVIEGDNAEQSFLYTFLINAKSLIFLDVDNEVIFKCRLDLINFIMAFLEEKNTPNIIILTIYRVINPNDLIISIKKNMKMLYCKLNIYNKQNIQYLKEIDNEDNNDNNNNSNIKHKQFNKKNNNINNHNKLLFDNKIRDYFVYQFFNNINFYKESLEFQISNRMYQFIKIMCEKHKIEEAEKIVKIIRTKNENDLSTIFHQKKLTSIQNNTNEMFQNDGQVIDEKDYENFFVVSFFEKIVKSIVVIQDETPQLVLYTINPLIPYISEHSKKDFNKNVNRDNRFTKLYELMEFSEYFYLEVNYYYYKSHKNFILKWLSYFNYYKLEVVSQIISIIINLILITLILLPVSIPQNLYKKEEIYSSNNYNLNLEDSSSKDITFRFNSYIYMKLVISVLGYISIGYNFLLIIIWIISKHGLYYKIEIKKYLLSYEIEENKLSRFNKAYISLFNAIIKKNQINIAILYFGLSLAAEFTNIYVFYGLQIIGLINLSSSMKNFMIALSKRKKQVLGIIASLLLVIYFFSTIAFFEINMMFISISKINKVNHLMFNKKLI